MKPKPRIYFRHMNTTDHFYRHWNKIACDMIMNVTPSIRHEARYGKNSVWSYIHLYTFDYILCNLLHALCVIQVVGKNHTELQLQIQSIMPTETGGFPFSPDETKQKAIYLLQLYRSM